MTTYTYTQRMESQGFKVIIKDVINDIRELTILDNLTKRYNHIVVIISDNKIIQYFKKNTNLFENSIIINDSIFILNDNLFTHYYGKELNELTNYKMFFKKEDRQCIICYDNNKIFIDVLNV
jgi:hypothetical protein